MTVLLVVFRLLGQLETTLYCEVVERLHARLIISRPGLDPQPRYQLPAKQMPEAGFDSPDGVESMVLLSPGP